MTELIFGVIILALLGYHTYAMRLAKQEQSKLINALVAQSPYDFKELEVTDKTPVEPTKPNPDADLVSLSDVSDEDFLTAIGVVQSQEANGQ